MAPRLKRLIVPGPESAQSVAGLTAAVTSGRFGVQPPFNIRVAFAINSFGGRPRFPVPAQMFFVCNPFAYHRAIGIDVRLQDPVEAQYTNGPQQPLSKRFVNYLGSIRPSPVFFQVGKYIPDTSATPSPREV